MKNYLLLLCLSVFAFGNAQIFIHICDENADGIENFDLTSTNAQLLANLPQAEYTVSFYESEANSQSGTNAISNAFSYTNTSNPQNIFVRIENTVTHETSYNGVELGANPKPIAHPAELYFCDLNELPIYNLDEAISQLTGNLPNLSVIFYDNPNPNSGNVIVGGGFTPSVFPTQVLGATVSDGQCTSERTSITLHTNDCGTAACTAPSDLAVTNLTSYSATLSWNMNSGSTGSWGVIVVPYGSPTPTTSTTGVAYVQSSPFTINFLVPDQCYTFYVRTYCTPNINVFSDWSEPFSFCSYDCENNGLCSESLILKAFLDANNNGVKDSGETVFNNGSFAYEINNSGTLLYGNTNNISGSFNIFESNPANNYDLSFAVNPELVGYYSSTTTYSNINVPAGSGSHTYYFPVRELQPYNNLEIQIIPYGAPPRPGFTYRNRIRYKNTGTTAVASGTINFTKDPAITIVSVSESGTVNSADGFSYAFSNLAPDIEREIEVVMQVPTIPTVNLGDLLTNSVTINPVTGDAFPLNNTASLSQVIVGSYDPNDKSEAHGGKVAMDAFNSNDYLTYTIQFENSGTANTEFLRVDDVLNPSLDASSFVMLGASHPYNMRRIDNKLIWNFYDTQLPPTSVDPASSHGYVQFKIKPTAGFDVGTIIPNAASIYFDFNPPIVTEPYQTEFVPTLSTAAFNSGDFYISPNPTHSMVQIGLPNSNQTIQRIIIYDVSGKVIRNLNDIYSTAINIDVSRYSKGLYFVEITTNDNQKTTKKLVIN